MLRAQSGAEGPQDVLFNSYAFLFAFLPVTVALYYLARARLGHTAALAVLAAASLFFYGWWDVRNIPLLLGSIAVNYLIGRGLAARPDRRLLTLGIVANLTVLAIFKYVNFAIGSVAALSGHDLGRLGVVLPLGISFFTFEQITFLVDVYRGRTKPGDALSYGLFVGFFPHLIAGPIMQHRDLGQQLQARSRTDDVWRNLGLGVAIFAVGLAKKVLIAETFEPWASGVFGAADRGMALPMGAAWVGALAYTFQIFFDFSGYSDMALGLGRMLGYQLPINFNAPYRSLSIIEFWRRWHISLSTFLRDYLYIPLGGNRKGEARRYVNLMATMLLGGLWHGAGWTFVAWGGLHGAYLVINHLWRGVVKREPGRLGKILGWALTFLAVGVAWVFFRAHTFAGAGRLLISMAGLHGFHSGADPTAIGWLALGFASILLLPDTAQLFRSALEPAAKETAHMTQVPLEGPMKGFVWRPNLRWALAGGVLLFWSVLYVSKTSEFIYYQF